MHALLLSVALECTTSNVSRGLRTATDFVAAFETASKERIDSLVVVEDTQTISQRRPIVDFAAKVIIPAVYGAKTFVDAGGFVSYGASFPALYRRTAFTWIMLYSTDSNDPHAVRGDFKLTEQADEHLHMECSWGPDLMASVAGQSHAASVAGQIARHAASLARAAYLRETDCVAGHEDGVSGLVAAVSRPLGGCASD